MLGVKWEPTTSFTHMPGLYWVEVSDLTSCDNVRQLYLLQKYKILILCFLVIF